MSETLCTGRHRDNTDKVAAPGAMLCYGCSDRLLRNLAALPDLYDACEAALVSTGQAGGERVTHRRDPGLVLSLPALKARTAIRAELVSWVRITHEERGLTVWPAQTIPAMATWLASHIGWISAQPWAPEMARTIGDTTSEARAAAYPGNVRRIEVGACPIANCAGNLNAYLHADDDVLPSLIRCDAAPIDDEHTPHEWPASEWVALGRMIVARVEAVESLRAQLQVI